MAVTAHFTDTENSWKLQFNTLIINTGWEMLSDSLHMNFNKKYS